MYSPLPKSPYTCTELYACVHASLELQTSQLGETMTVMPMMASLPVGRAGGSVWPQ